MKIIIVTTEFARVRLVLMIAFLREVILKMTGNPTYPTPSPTLADVTTAADEAEAAMEAAADGDRVQIAIRNDKTAVLAELGRNLAAYVQGNCGNLVANVLGAGFKVRKTASPVGPLPAPGNLRLSYTGMTGEFLLRIGAVKGKLTYTIQKSESADGPFETIATSSSGRKVISGFTPMKQYWVRACANGTAGPGPFSVPTCAIAI
jgi:hypothetical protein